MKRTETPDERPAVVQRLYEVFARYSASAKTMSACSCCVSEAEIMALFADPLSQLPAQTLENYSWKAMTTWGDEIAWKHFLPRLCELTLESSTPGWFEMEWIGNKFSYVDWRLWPEDEIETVRDFWREVTFAAAKSNDWFNVNLWLGELTRLGENGEADLEKWLQNAAPEEVFDLDEWMRRWQNLDSPLANWAKHPKTIDKLLERL